MRDLIDRAELLAWMNRIAAILENDPDISPSYLNGFCSAIRDVEKAPSVSEQADA